MPRFTLDVSNAATPRPRPSGACGVSCGNEEVQEGMMIGSRYPRHVLVGSTLPITQEIVGGIVESVWLGLGPEG